MEVLTKQMRRGEWGSLVSCCQCQTALFGHDRGIVIKSACQALIMAGSDSTSTTLTWVLSLLLNHPDVLRKAREELDQIVGRDKQVDDSDIKDLVYLQAIIKETMRLYPAAPLLERLAIEDCIIGGFHVQVGTPLFVNGSKVHLFGVKRWLLRGVKI